MTIRDLISNRIEINFGTNDNNVYIFRSVKTPYEFILYENINVGWIEKFGKYQIRIWDDTDTDHKFPIKNFFEKKLK